MNAAANQLTAGAIVGLFLGDKKQRTSKTQPVPSIGDFTASVLTKLPNLLKPATSPNHRQFVLSIVFASLLGVGLHKLHQWETQERPDELLKSQAMLAISDYLIYLALAPSTAKLPLFVSKA